MTRVEELKANMFQFVAELSERTGVDLDPEEVWSDALAWGKMHIHTEDGGNAGCPACLKANGAVPLCPECGAIKQQGQCKFCEGETHDDH